MNAARKTLSPAQRGMLYNLSHGPVPTIMALVRMEYSGRGHAASYARFHRLRARGLVAMSADKVWITEAGKAVLS